MLKSDMDVEAWRLEVERVLPQLKITVKTGIIISFRSHRLKDHLENLLILYVIIFKDGQDWRWRQEQMNTHVTGIIDVIREIDTPLKKLVTEAKSASDKVMTRENFLNNQFKGLLDQLHESQVDKRKRFKFLTFISLFLHGRLTS
jgi:estrogen-related receptor beta like 1